MNDQIIREKNDHIFSHKDLKFIKNILPNLSKMIRLIIVFVGVKDWMN